jgi:hypothetical protein
LAAFDPAEVEGALAAGVAEELSFDDFDDDEDEDDPLDDEPLSDEEATLRLSVR